MCKRRNCPNKTKDEFSAFANKTITVYANVKQKKLQGRAQKMPT